jgi:hypothetical protein
MSSRFIWEVYDGLSGTDKGGWGLGEFWAEFWGIGRASVYRALG